RPARRSARSTEDQGRRLADALARAGRRHSVVHGRDVDRYLHQDDAASRAAHPARPETLRRTDRRAAARRRKRGAGAAKDNGVAATKEAVTALSTRASVLDASSLLAMIREEPGGDRVREAIDAGALISAVNWAEVLARLIVGASDAHEVST